MTKGVPNSLTRSGRRLQQSDRSQQIDLFVGVTPTQMPAWPDFNTFPLRRLLRSAQRIDLT
jgi:hypothetical protein